MGISERKEREKNRRRETILKAAKKIISKSGVEGMSMDQVAEATELNKATLYLYFNNKDDLIDAIVYEGLTTLEKKFQEADSQSLSRIEKVLHLIHAQFAFYKQFPVYFHTLNHQERRIVKARMETPYATKGNEIASRIFKNLADSLRQGIKEGSIRKDIDIHVLLILLFAQIYGVMHTIYAKKDIYQDVLHLDSETIEKAALKIIEQFLRKK